jgi:hypothetical protein
MSITKRDIEKARKAEAELGPRIIAARYRRSSGKLEVEYDNGISIGVPVTMIQDIATLPEAPTAAALAKIEVSGSGRYIDFPKIDASIYGPAFLQGVFGTKAWMGQLARTMGASKSPAKAAAARENGRKGGRPRKSPPIAPKAPVRRVKAVSLPAAGRTLGQ